MGPLRIEPLPGYEPELGRWLWALEGVRRRTLGLVRGLDQRTLDWEGPDGGENAIGSLLYHIAFREMQWLFLGILRQDFPPWTRADGRRRERRGQVTRVVGVPLEDHLACLRCSRQFLLETFRPMSLAEWRRPRHPLSPRGRAFTPEWAVFHLVEHEAGHAYQISALQARAARYLAARSGRDRHALSANGDLA